MFGISVHVSLLDIHLKKLWGRILLGSLLRTSSRCLCKLYLIKLYTAKRLLTLVSMSSLRRCTMLETSFYDVPHIHTLLLLLTSLISLHTLILYIPMPFSIEFPLMTKGGVRLDVLLNATTRRDEQGNVIGVVGTCPLFV